jgi:histidine ammonia-lyase
MSNYTFDRENITLSVLQDILENDRKIELSASCITAVNKCRNYLDQLDITSDRLIYGVNTGFGSLCNTKIPPSDLSQLQLNLVRSHACGIGERVPNEIVRLMLLLKIIGLSRGHSGVQLIIIERLLFFYNNKIYPLIYQNGSLGASGDLAPLAHLSLPLVGEGEVEFEGKTMTGAAISSHFNLQQITFQSKEGLALLNGTQFMSAYMTYSLLKAEHLNTKFLYSGAISLEAYDGRIEPFQDNVNQIRNHQGQIEIANSMRNLLFGSELIVSPKVNVQDPYSFRCIPQVHGASWDVFSMAKTILHNEINAVTDNPIIFPDEEQIVSAGNFHGQPLAIWMDFLAIALSELGAISERRIYKLISGTRDLPAFLVSNPGINSGCMIVQYTAASVVSQNKQLCTPSSIDSIDSSNGQEDHVSMGANAATKLFRVVENCYKIAGLELFTAAQAIEFKRPKKTSEILENYLLEYRKIVPHLKEDTYLSPYLQASINFVTHN